MARGLVPRVLSAVGMAALLLVAACGAGGDGTDDAEEEGSPPEGESAAAPSGPYGDSGVLDSDPVAPGAERLRFEYGPVTIEPGQNNIEFSEPIDMPTEDGYIVRTAVDLQRADGSVPAVDVIHLHHGVWLNTSRDNPGYGGPERFFAAGEEKTIMNAPEGFGYDFSPDDTWIINYMIHNAVAATDEVYLTYAFDFIPDTAPEAEGIVPVHPVWMDVENPSAYPVFDVLPIEGQNTFTYPDDDPDAYAGREKANELVLETDGVLIGTGGHVHPGGLHTDLFVRRDGATAEPGSAAAPNVEGDTAHIYRSEAEYWDPNGPVSWDMAMTATPEEWRVGVQAGDVLEISATYENEIGAWYEAMGIMVVWMADDVPGPDPFVEDVLLEGEVTHGHLAENDNKGGTPVLFDEDPSDLPDGEQVDRILIEDFTYEHGDISEGPSEVPVVPQGQSIIFDNSPDAPRGNGIWHTITSCKAPCTGATGIAFPLADGETAFDSGELGEAEGINALPTAGTNVWETPSDLDPGTYTYFCRIHPFMRGAFRVTPGQ